MSDVTSFEVTGDWRHIVDDGMVDGDNLPDEVPLTGKVVFRPVYPTVATAGVPVTAYTLGPVTALVAGGVLNDLQGRPGVMLAGKVGEHTVRWSAETSLRFQEQKVDYPRVTFDLTEDVRLTGIITQAGPSLTPTVVDPRIEALAASVESVNLAVVEAEGHASTAAEQVPLAKAEADRAIGLAGAQDEHVAGVLEDPQSATHAALLAVGNATYALKDEVATEDFNPLRWFRAQVASADTSPVDVFVLSDSVAEGAGAVDKSRRWLDRFQAGLRRAYQPDGIVGGEGYVPIGYSPGTVPNRWSYQGATTVVSDTFARTGDLDLSMPTVGPAEWRGGPGGFLLDGADAVAASTQKTMFIQTGSSADREMTIVGTLPTFPSTAAMRFSMFLMFVDNNNYLRLFASSNGASTTWHIECNAAGVTTQLATWATAPIPSTATNFPFTASIKIDGLTVTGQINSSAVTGTLTQSQKTAVTSTNTGITMWPGTKMHDFTIAVPNPSLVPTILTNWGLGKRAAYVGKTRDCKSASITFTGTGADLILTGNSATGIVSVSLDGQTPVTLDTQRATETNGLIAQIRSAQAGSHTLKVTSETYVIVEGAMLYHGDETAGIRVWDGARSGTHTGGFNALGAWHNTLKAVMVPDLVIMAFGLNDYNQNRSPELFKTQLVELIAGFRNANPNVSIILHNSFLRGDTAAPTYPWQQYLDALAEVAGNDDGVMLVDLNAAVLGWPLVPTALRSMWTADKVHPSPQGHGVIAETLLSALR